MTTSEQRLLALVARMVIRIAKNLGLEDTAREVESQLLTTSHELVQLEAEETFSDAVMALEDASLDASLQHTGGGVYVLWHRLDDDPAGPCVGITPDDLHPGFWTVVSYRSNQDEGMDVRNEVSLAGLADTVYELASDLRGAMVDWSRIWTLPCLVTVREDDDGELRFTFLPAASDAGYFGAHAYDFETGSALPESVREFFWERLSNYIDPFTSEVTMYWEG